MRLKLSHTKAVKRAVAVQSLYNFRIENALIAVYTNTHTHTHTHTHTGANAHHMVKGRKYIFT